MEISFIGRSRLSVIDDSGRRLEVQGEVFLERDPDFMIYPESLRQWADGISVTDDERRELLERIVQTAAERGWNFHVSWP